LVIPGCLALLIICVAAGYFLYSLMVVDPPGKGAKAELGYQTCAPIIAALERYHAQQGTYPKTLDLLVPDFIPSVPTSFDNLDLGYRLADDSYRLDFHYTGPGMNTCSYSPETGWRCSGYY
jgi:hypothetical protein